jgi:hypothetical protein
LIGASQPGSPERQVDGVCNGALHVLAVSATAIRAEAPMMNPPTRAPKVMSCFFIKVVYLLIKMTIYKDIMMS